MNFELPEQAHDISADLREIEQTKGQLSASAKAKILQAAQLIESYRALVQSCVLDLELAAKMRAGLMDSEQKQQELQRHIRMTLKQVADQLKAVAP